MDEAAVFDDWQTGGNAPAERLQIDIAGWEGPLDLLLTLARNQRVDLKAISILELVEQYLAFVEQARGANIELAADYLVMAAWLALLKSAMLLPKEIEQDPSPEEMALRLQLRLQRLAAMRDAGARLLARDRLGRDVFARPAPEGLRTIRRRLWDADLYELIAAYGKVRARTAPALHVVAARRVISLDTALQRLSTMLGLAIDWRDLISFLPPEFSGDLRRSALASSFVAALELARTGRCELNQEAAFAPLYLKARA